MRSTPASRAGPDAAAIGQTFSLDAAADVHTAIENLAVAG